MDDILNRMIIEQVRGYRVNRPAHQEVSEWCETTKERCEIKISRPRIEVGPSSTFSSFSVFVDRMTLSCTGSIKTFFEARNGMPRTTSLSCNNTTRNSAVLELSQDSEDISTLQTIFLFTSTPLEFRGLVYVNWGCWIGDYCVCIDFI